MKTNLDHGCYFTELWVSPKNWKTLTSKKSLQLNWYIQCKFYDPLFKDKYPYGFPYRKKLNKLTSLDERKEAIEFLLKEIPILFKEKGYNPITKKYMKVIELEKANELHPDLSIIEAFNLAREKLKCTDKHKNEVRIAVNRFNKAVRELRMAEIKIKDFRRSQLKTILEYQNLTDHCFNKTRAYLSSLFNELIEYDCCEINLIRDIRKRKITKIIRETLEDEQLRQIADYLEEKYPTFYRYMMIFFYSGARSAELLRIKKSEVNLEKQEYKVIIQKGSQYIETLKVILPNALPYWKEIMQEAKTNDYLFAKNLKPAPVPIPSKQITIRWRNHIKNKLVWKNDEIIEIKKLKKGDTNYIPITADFYSLKHLFLDKIDQVTSQISEENLSSKMASHTSPTITNSVYLVTKKKRERERLKSLYISM